MSALSARDLAGGYGRREVVHGVSLEVDNGMCLAVLGPNGAGKSTLLRLLIGILPPRRGTVALCGVPLTSLSRREVARRVGFVPQAVPFTFPLLVEEIVLQARAPHLGPWRPPGQRDRELAFLALQQVGLSGREQEPITRLSGGERQRVLLARALAGQPELLLLDEPAASLDVLHQLTLMEILTQAKGMGTGIVMVAHDWNLALRVADKILIMDEGSIAALGKPDDLPLAAILGSVFKVSVTEVDNPQGPPILLPNTLSGPPRDDREAV